MAFRNDGSFFEQFQRMQERQAVESSAVPEVQAEAQAEPPVIEDGQPYAAAATFTTEQPGYFFGTGRGPYTLLQDSGSHPDLFLLAGSP